MLEVDRLVRRYGDLVALQDLSFSVGPGELFGFVGSNGRSWRSSGPPSDLSSC